MWYFFGCLFSWAPVAVPTSKLRGYRDLASLDTFCNAHFLAKLETGKTPDRPLHSGTERASMVVLWTKQAWVSEHSSNGGERGQRAQ